MLGAVLTPLTRRLLPLAALAVLLPACGGGGGGTAAAVGGSASVVPASAVAYVTVDTDLSSSQWNAVDELLNRFPAKARLLTMLRASFEEDAKVSWENDVKPALGDTLDVVVIDTGSGPRPVFLVQPNDEGKFDSLVQKLNESEPGDDAVTGEFEGWRLIADKQLEIDAFREAASGAKLADDQSFEDAISDLDDEALVKAYVDGKQLRGQLEQALGGLSGGQDAQKALGELQTGAMQLVAQDEGFELSAIARGSMGDDSLEQYTPELLDVVPAGALLVASFRGGTQSAQMQAGLGPALGMAPQLAPLLNGLKELGPLLANENALYVLSGFPIPEVTLIAQPQNADRGVASVRKIAGTVGSLAGAASFRPTQLDGVAATEMDLGEFSLFFGKHDGRVFVSTSRRVVEQLKGGGEKLAGDPIFEEASQAAELPDQTAGFLYVNLKDTIPLIESLAQLSDERLPPDVTTNLRHLRSFIFHATSEAQETRVTAFLGIR